MFYHSSFRLFAEIFYCKHMFQDFINVIKRSRFRFGLRRYKLFWKVLNYFENDIVWCL